MKTTFLKISKFLLLLLVVSINLREPYLHSREILFFLFIIFSLPYGNYRNLFYMLLLLALSSISLLYNIIIPGSNLLQGPWYQIIVNSAYLLLLVFCNKKYYQVIIKGYLISAVIVSFITVVFWIICYNNQEIRWAVFDYFNKMKELEGLTVLDVNVRLTLGYPFFFVYYRTSPIIIPALCYLYVKRLRGVRTRANFWGVILFTVALILSGARANILCAALLMFFYNVFLLYKNKHLVIATIVLIASICGGFNVANKFLNDKGSNSSNIKKMHQEDYFKIYNSDYIRTFFFGWGCGSSFYSKGYGVKTQVTELSHWETIRRYGVVSFLLIMFFIWLEPLIMKMRTERGVSKYFYVVIVLSYIFVACTNPFLIDSIGFCALLFFKSFFEYDTLNRNGYFQRRIISPRTA